MAASKYMISSRIFHHYPYHESFKALWENVWKPKHFRYTAYEDFEPVVNELIGEKIERLSDWDDYARTFFPRAELLMEMADQAQIAGEISKAAELFLRASALYLLARYPIPRSEAQREAWQLQQNAYLRAQALLPAGSGVSKIDIPHVHAISSEGKNIPVYFLARSSASAATPAPVVILLGGLDGYKPEIMVHSAEFMNKGIALVALEISGKGDSPADPADPFSADRQMESVLDWIRGWPELDEKNVCVWGVSTGGFDAIRAAHMFCDRLKGAVGHGGGCHHMLDQEWLDEVNYLEFDSDLANALAYRFGYGFNVETFKRERSDRFSLLKTGVLDKKCTRLLLLHGYKDAVFPIDDMYLALSTGPCPKEARLFREAGHMGGPQAFKVAIGWIYDLFGASRYQGDIEEHQKSSIIKPQFAV